MGRLIPTFAFAVVLVASAGSVGQEGKGKGKDKKAGPTGVWVREAGGIEVKFDFTGGKSPFKASVFKGDDGINLTCKYEIKGGVVKAEITVVEEKGNFPNPPPVGFEFSFKWAPKDDTAELSDLAADNIDNVKPIVEGEYNRVQGKDKKG